MSAERNRCNESADPQMAWRKTVFAAALLIASLFAAPAAATECGWKKTPFQPLGPTRPAVGALVAWTGSEIFTFGEDGGSLYSPEARQWRAVPAPPLPSGKATAVLKREPPPVRRGHAPLEPRARFGRNLDEAPAPVEGVEPQDTDPALAPEVTDDQHVAPVGEGNRIERSRRRVSVEADPGQM